MALTDYITLNDYAQLNKGTVRGYVSENLVWNSKAMEFLPLETIGGLGTTIVSYDTLPSMGFRKVNEEYAQTKGEFKQKTEVITALGGYIDIDKLIVRANNNQIAQMLDTQTKMATASMAFEFNHYFINGDRGVDEDQFDGLLKRITDIYNAGYTGQIIQCGTTTNSIFDTKAHALSFCHSMDALIDACNGGDVDALLMNGYTKRAVVAALRMSENLTFTKDNYGRSFPRYGEIPIYDMGLRADQSTWVMLEENATKVATASGGYGSIIAVKFGIGTHLWGIQTYGLEVDKLGIINNGVTNRLVVDWPIGLAINNPRSVARMYSVKCT